MSFCQSFPKITHHTWYVYSHITTVAAPHNDIYFDDWHILHYFKQKKMLGMVLLSEIREIILDQIAYSCKCSSSKASMRTTVSLTFIRGPMILPYISSTAQWINSILGWDLGLNWISF